MTNEERTGKLQAISDGVTRLVAERDAAMHQNEAVAQTLDEAIDAVHAAVIAASPPPEESAT